METLAERLLKAREQRELNEYGRVLSDEERDKLIDEEKGINKLLILTVVSDSLTAFSPEITAEFLFHILI